MLRLLQRYSISVIPVLKASTVGENGNPDRTVFKEYWIPDKDLGNDKLRLLQDPLLLLLK